ncbi:HNH endonuclease signature motif containing protein [Brooklawnia cerclae]|uniref:HNH nuclease domain-containing protein n=1 Tax=Brooklawnia cerclae TaxID=349934 RepID=A0ABX0SJG6_9ACTN|nr:HNH endonuclease signature motif containing protein [Brooklawnia cerclae]NIH58120.1 hypothetical protein [Brooklawnia cerclae]
MEPLRQPTVADLTALVEGLADLPTAVGDDRELVGLIGALEQVKHACSAAQARATVALRTLRDEAASTPAQRRDAHRSVVSEVALARHESPHRAGMLVGLASALTNELPHTMAALTAGQISEWRATLVCRETACISRDDRLAVDAEISGRLATLSDREIAATARNAAYARDPHSVVARAARAQADRRVTIRPAPDCMATVSALLPVAQGVAVYAALVREADSVRATGDSRGRGQVMADTLVARVTGQAVADQVPVEVQLVITDEALLGESDTPARIGGFGPIPAGVARAILVRNGAGDTETAQWIRRLYARPEDGRLVAMESTRRLFPAGLRRYIAARDAGTCRTPWCGAPIGHIDHIVAVQAGGPTTAANGQGLCVHCNQAKQAPGWRAAPGPDGAVTITTPTGHRYASLPPPLPREHPVIEAAARAADNGREQPLVA